MNFPESPTTLEDARAKLENYCKLGPIGDGPIAPTGEPYVEICSGGRKAEGESLPALCASAELAVKLWFDAAMYYFRGAAKSGTHSLYWRIVPELDHWDIVPADCAKLGMNRTVYAVYSRLLISSKPHLDTSQPHAA